MLPADDSARRFYEDLVERFGSDDVVLVALRSSELFSPDGLATVVRTTRALAQTASVHHVDGLATALRLRPVDGDVEILGYLETLPGTLRAARGLRAELLADPLRAGTFVSYDGTATAILVTFQRIPEDQFLAQSLDLRLRCAEEPSR